MSDKVDDGGRASQTKHTPLPWQYSHRETSDGMYSTQVYDEAGETIATLAWYPVQEGSLTRTAREANAALIVRAVNSHAELVAALEHVSDWFKRDEDSGDELLWTDGYRDLCETVRTALARAKVQP